MVAMGITSSGVGRLMLHEGQNKFYYSQALLYYKDDVGDLYFEQDRAPSHISKANNALINELFKNNSFKIPLIPQILHIQLKIFGQLY